jgi:anti-sigma regulatory factor (Ser/Thr protein kinase)
MGELGSHLLLIELPAEPASVPKARRAVAEIARDFGAEPGDVALAVSEAVTNAVTHGYRDGRGGRVMVEVADEGDRLRVDISDRGVGMSPNPTSQGLGMGLAVIGKIASTVRIEDIEPGVRISMVFERAG